MPDRPAAPPRAARDIAIPSLFVLLWSSGFVGTKAGLLYAEPFTFLLIRFAAAAAILALIAFFVRAAWPTDRWLLGHLVVSGVLIHATYLGPNFWGASRGFPVGITALIGALQPILTALVAQRFLSERVRAIQWIGLVVGLVGIVMVLSDKIAFDWAYPIELAGILWGIVSLTLGTLYQRRFCARMNIWSGSAVQLGVASMVMLVAAWGVESFRVEWTPAFMLAVGWLVFLSVAIYALMHVLFLHGAAARVASLFYLVPPITSSALAILFGEHLGLLAILGMFIAIIGVVLAARA